MLDAWLDLVLGSCCSACGTPGRALCRGCAGALPVRASLCWPTPIPAGLVPPWSTGEYAEPLRSLVVDHKDGGRLSLARPLGSLLAVAVAAAHHAAAGGSAAGPVHRVHPVHPVCLVPVPSHPSVARSRGQDPMLRIAHAAAGTLRRQGVSVLVCPLLRVASRPGDQAGLGAGERAQNVAGRFRLRREGAPRPGALLLVDDVITTGATLREAQRALEAGGLHPVAAATVAATRRRHPGSGPRLPIHPPGG